MNNIKYKICLLAVLLFFSKSVYGQVQTYIVTNNTDEDIINVSISPNDANNWGRGLNMTGSIAPGKSFEFSQQFDNSNCIHDIRYLSTNGTYYFIQDVNLCSTTNILLVRSTNNKQEDINSDDSEKDRKTDKDVLEDKIQTDREKMEDDRIDKK